MIFNGMYRGTVMNNVDPLGKARIRVNVFGVFDDVEDDHLPWAEYADPLMGGGLDSGGTFIPDEGDKVWVFFENGDYNQPVYFAGAPSMLDMPIALEEGYPKTRIFKTKAGHIISLNDEVGNETIRIIHNSGTYTEYQPDGSIREVVVGNYHRTVHGNMRMDVFGNNWLNVYGNSATDVGLNISNTSGENTSNFIKGHLSTSCSNSITTSSGSTTTNNAQETLTNNAAADLINNVDGDHKTNVVGNISQISNKSTIIDVIGDYTKKVAGNIDVQSIGDNTMFSGGSVRATSTLTSVVAAGGGYKIQSIVPAVINAPLLIVPLTELGTSGVDLVLTPMGDIVPTESYAESRENANQVVSATGSTNSAWDEPETPIPDDGEWEEPEAKASVEEPNDIEEEIEEGAPPPPVNAECENITTVDYKYQLSKNFTLRDLSIGCVYPHPIKAQNGLSVSAIICNLKMLCQNVLEPLKAQFPEVSRINSGFRVGNGGSQHLKGMAVDIQVGGWSPADYSKAIKWCAENLAYSQLICEHGNSIWIHISYDSSESPPRRKKTTYHPKMSPQYQNGLINYYDNKKKIG